MRHLWSLRDPGGKREHRDLKVDPIPRECVGGVKISFLKGAHAEFVWLTITMAVLLRPESGVFLWTEMANNGKKLPTDDWWFDQTEEMVNVHGLTRECTAEERRAAKHYAKFFLVPKKDRWGRAIFNCRQANRDCRAPPSVNLPRVEHLLRKIHEVTAGKGLFAFEMDFRCWFYQIPIIGELARHFIIACKEKFYMLIGCPMGWSWSPFLAQSVTWGMLLQMASTIGFIMWDNMVRLRDMNKVGWALAVLSEKTQGVKTRAQWDANANLDEATREKLNVAKARTTEDADVENTWMRVDVSKSHRGRIILASDASSTTLAWLVMGSTLEECSKPVIIAAKVRGHRNIFLKELEAATLAVEGIAGTGFCGEIVLLCDNAAAVLAIRKGYSSVPGANELLTRIWVALEKSGEALTVLRVPGKDNVADSPTRGADLEERRLKASWGVVKAHDSGEGAPGVTRTASGMARLGDFIEFARGERKRVREEPQAPQEPPQGESDEEDGDEDGEEDSEGEEAALAGDE